MLYIRQGATHKVVLGPAVAVGDGFTPVTTLALSSADEAEAILHDNGTVVDISGYTWAAITTADGYYHLTLQSGISNTVGHLTIVVNDDSLCLPLRADFTVLEENVYDMLFAASADLGTTVDTIASDLVQVYSDTTIIYSDTTIATSKAVQIYSDTTIVVSDTTAIHSDTTAVHSDTTAIHTQTTTIASDVVIVASDLLQVYSDTTIIASKAVQIYSDTTAIEAAGGSLTAAQDSKLTRINSKSTQIYSDSTVIASDVVQIYSDTTIIYSDTTAIESAGGSLTAAQDSKLTRVNSKATQIYSDTTVIEAGGGSLTAAQASKLTQVHSDLIIVGSDVVQVYSDTTHIHSKAVQIYSDSSAIHSDTTIIASDLVIVASDVLQVYSDTTVIASDLVVAASDVIEVRENTDYPDGFVYVDPTNGASGTTVGVNGTIRNPSDTLANAATIASSRGVNRIRALNNGTVTTGTFSNVSFDLNGTSWTINQAVTFSGVCRVYSSAGVSQVDPHIGGGQTTVDLDSAVWYENLAFSRNLRATDYCYLKNCIIGTLSSAVTFTILGDNGTDPVYLEDCYTTKASGLTFDCSGGADLIMSGWYGDFTITNLAAGTTVQVYGWGKVTLASSCTGGTIRYTSHIEIVDQASGAVTEDLVSEPGDLTQILSDTTRIESKAVQIYSDTTIAVSKATQIYSDTTVVASDVALLETTRAEPGQGAPAATASPLLKLDWLYKAWRNKKIQDASTFELYADDGTTVDQKATVSDGGTDFTFGKIASGP